jgi:hypothetical protein
MDAPNPADFEVVRDPKRQDEEDENLDTGVQPECAGCPPANERRTSSNARELPSSSRIGSTSGGSWDGSAMVAVSSRLSAVVVLARR